MNSLKYIQDYYDVPAEKGQKVLYEGKEGTIVGASGPHLKVRFSDEKRDLILHPTWKVEYLPSEDSSQS
jgi:hypothetical protein